MYEEKVIHGILCYRTTPNGQWHEFTKAELTARIMDHEQSVKLKENNHAILQHNKPNRNPTPRINITSGQTTRTN